MKASLTSLFIGVSVVAVLGSWGYGHFEPEPDEIVCISVGQGDSTLVESEGRAILIDVGPKRNGVDAGSEFVVPAMAKYGAPRLDMVLLSHPDEDHIGGLASVYSHFPNIKVLIPQCFENDPKMVDALQNDGVPNRSVEWVGSMSGTVGRFHIEVRCPPWNGIGDDNEGSMFVHVSDGDASFVTSGDAPKDAERYEVGLANWKATVIHLGHHGSKTSTSTLWLQTVQAKDAIVSCGYHNEYGHPHPETLAQCARFHLRVYRTDLEGDIVLQDRDHRWVITRQLSPGTELAAPSRPQFSRRARPHSAAPSQRSPVSPGM